MKQKKQQSKILFASTILAVLFFACKVEPKTIQYGKDHCAFCDMTVVDKTHSAEYVTKKGKAYVFDAVECMVRQINQKNNMNDLAFVLVADYANPGELVDAQTATYLISKAIKSPMGANLSAFKHREDAEKIQAEKGGELYSWKQITEKLKK